MIQNNDQAALEYLKITDSSRHFSFYILKLLIEDPRTVHAERIKNTWNLVVINPVDILWFEQPFKVTTHRVKLWNYITLYEALTKSSITRLVVVTMFKKNHKSDSPEVKFIANDLYYVPPSFKPFELVDAIDTRYLNQNHVLSINTLNKVL